MTDLDVLNLVALKVVPMKTTMMTMTTQTMTMTTQTMTMVIAIEALVVEAEEVVSLHPKRERVAEVIIIAKNAVYVEMDCSICVQLMNARNLVIVYTQIYGSEDCVLPTQTFAGNLLDCDNQG